MDKEFPGYRQRSNEELQMAIASVALRVAILSREMERYILPKNALLAAPDPTVLAQNIGAVGDVMMEMARDLLGANEDE